MELIKIDFTEIKLLDIGGKEIPYEKNEIHKRIAEALYFHSQDLDYVEIGREINKGEEIGLRKKELQYIGSLFSQINTDKIPAFIKKAVKEFIEKKISEQKK